MTQRIAVFGYGTVGRTLTMTLVARGDAVRIVQRHLPAALPLGCTFQSADASDPASIARACADVDTVVCCLGFPYDSALWETVWPSVMRGLLEGCSKSGARFVFADNLYLYGPQSRPLTEDMPLTNFGRKPAVRATITRLWQAAHQEKRVRAVAVRASDFYGPDSSTSVISAFGVARLVAGKRAIMPYPTDQPHDFTYVPDFARALVSLIDAPEGAYGQAWHVPNAPIRTLRDVVTRAAGLAGKSPNILVLPQILMPIAGLFSKEIREIGEMRFQWDRPYIVDATKFADAFWHDATSFDDGLAATIRFYSSIHNKPVAET